jgi:DNA (cytosine-5)-methyltransferase 1
MNSHVKMSDLKTGGRASWQPLKGLRVCSLFAGAGGLDLGFTKAGHKIVWANDIDPDSVKTYRANIGNHISLGDIADFDPRTVPSFDVLVGGFPCQGFSRANVHRVDDDHRNKLYVQIIRFLKTLKPRFFLLENVRGLLSLDGGAAFARIKTELESVGYHVQHKVLNAADFGVPQNRIRVFIVGVRKKDAKKYRYLYPEQTHSKDGNIGKNWVSIGSALDGMPEPDATHKLKNHVCSKYKITNRDFTGHRATDPNKPSPTILARGNGGGGVCAIQHPKNHRRLSVRESAIIQTFPKDFEFVGSLNSMYRQIGNAVPVQLAKAVAKGFQVLD